MNKKSIIFLIISILFFICALGIFIYSRIINTSSHHINSENRIIISDTHQNEFYFYDINGNKLSLDNFSNKPTIILFWKSDNSNSFTLINIISKYYEEYKEKINFLTINVNEPDIDLELIEEVKAANFSIPIYFDTELTSYSKFSLQKLPELLFLEEDGSIKNTIYEKISEDSFIANIDLLIKNF